MTSTLVSILITIDKLTLYSQTKIDPGVFHIIIHCLHDNGENKRGRQRKKQHISGDILGQFGAFTLTAFDFLSSI